MIVRVAQENLRDGMAAVRALWTARSLKELYRIQVHAAETITRRNIGTTVALGRAVGTSMRQSVTRPFAKRS